MDARRGDSRQGPVIWSADDEVGSPFCVAKDRTGNATVVENDRGLTFPSRSLYLPLSRSVAATLRLFRGKMEERGRRRSTSTSARIRRPALNLCAARANELRVRHVRRAYVSTCPTSLLWRTLLGDFLSSHIYADSRK